MPSQGKECPCARVVVYKPKKVCTEIRRKHVSFSPRFYILLSAALHILELVIDLAIHKGTALADQLCLQALLHKGADLLLRDRV